MLVKINVMKPVAIPNINQRSVDLKAGVHEIEEIYLDHWYVKALMNQGIITIVKSKPNINFKPLPTTDEKKPAVLVENYRPVVGKVTINHVEEIKPKPPVPKVDEVVKVITPTEIPPNRGNAGPAVEEIAVEEKIPEEKTIVEAKVEEKEIKPVVKTIKRRKK